MGGGGTGYFCSFYDKIPNEQLKEARASLHRDRKDTEAQVCGGLARRYSLP